MPTDTDLKAIWQKQHVAKPLSPRELVERAMTMRKRAMRKLMLVNVIMVGTSCYLGAIIWAMPRHMLPAKAGAAMVILAMLLYGSVYNTLLPLLKKADSTSDAQTFLKQLLKLKRRQDLLSSTMLAIYFLLLSIGLLLYFAQVTATMAVQWKILVYTVTAAWVAFAWFYMRPRSIRRQQQELLPLIEKLEEIRDDAAD